MVPEGATDVDDVRYWAIGPDELAAQIVDGSVTVPETVSGS